MESFEEIFSFEKLLVVSCCGTPLLISYHLKYTIYENFLGLDFESFVILLRRLYPRPTNLGKTREFISDSLWQPRYQHN